MRPRLPPRAPLIASACPLAPRFTLEAPRCRRGRGRAVSASRGDRADSAFSAAPAFAQAKEVFSGGAEHAQRTGGAAADVGASYAEQAKAQMGSASDAAAQQAQHAKDVAGGYAEHAKQTLYGAGDAAAARAAEAKDTAAETAAAAQEHAGGLFEAVRAAMPRHRHNDNVAP